MTVIESMAEVTVAHAVEIEREGGLVWGSLYGNIYEVNGTSRLCLSLLAEQICGGRRFEDVVSHWPSVRKFRPAIEALHSLKVSDKVILFSNRLCKCVLL